MFGRRTKLRIDERPLPKPDWRNPMFWFHLILGTFVSGLFLSVFARILMKPTPNLTGHDAVLIVVTWALAFFVGYRYAVTRTGRAAVEPRGFEVTPVDRDPPADVQ